MLQQSLAAFVFFNVFTTVLSRFDVNFNSGNVITPKTFAIWRNATVPFYVDPHHFDHEQTLAILTALSMFAFKTCIKFKPVMARPSSKDDVMFFVNAQGTRRCEIEPKGHSVYNPHLVKLGYECLKSPHIDMIIMKALGFPFEHNRITRDLYIEVLEENIESGAVELFTKEDTLPLELRFLPYDVNSVMHFGNRDYSKNGHRTIIFKDHNVQQKRTGLTEIDLKKIEIVYGPECRARDRQEKLELCQSYPGVARRKREAGDNAFDDGEQSTSKPEERRKRDLDIVTKSLRVNPDITPPPDNRTEDITKILTDLGIDQAVQEIVEQVYKVSSLALRNAREKYCNNSDNKPAITEDIKVSKNSSDILGIIEVVAGFAKGMVDNAVKNLTKFCEVSEGIEAYQRYSCTWESQDSRCRQTYRSTKSGPAQYSTQHRPFIKQPTKHYGAERYVNYGREGAETGKDSKEPTTKLVRRKREAIETSENPANKFDGENKPDVIDEEKGEADLGKKLETKDKKEEAGKVGTKDMKQETFKAEPQGKKEEAAKSGVKGKKEESVKPGAKNKKEDAAKAGAKVKTMKGNNVKTKRKNKTDLRMGTMSPGLVEDNKNRRFRGKKHRGKHSEDYSKHYDLDSAEEVHKNKYSSEENGEEKRPKEIEYKESHYKMQEKKRIQKQRRGKHTAVLVKDDNEESEISENEREQRFVIYKKDKNRDVNEEEDEREEDSEEEQRPRKKNKHRKEKPRRTSLPKTVTLSKKNEDFYKDRRWPDGEVIYMIQVDTTYDLDDMQSRIEEVKEILKERTCVRLKEIKPGEANKYEDYIVIDNSPDYVTGRVGGRQNFGSIELYQGGQHRQHAAMMVMAMLGFYFEVSRHDRDKYIRVHMRHVRPDKLHHFEKVRSDATLPLPYDYESATHPAWQFWRQIGRTGISTVATFKEKDPDGKIMNSLGHHEKLLSDNDIVKINSVYGIDCFRHSRAKIERNSSTATTPWAEEKNIS